MNGQVVWVVGQVRPGQEWEFQGVFADQSSAIAACRNEYYFIGPCIVGWPAPDDRMDSWPGAYFPL